MAYVEMTTDFTRIKKNQVGTAFTRRQIVAAISVLAIGIPSFLLFYFVFKWNLTIALLLMMIICAPIAFGVLFEWHGKGLEVWAKVAWSCLVTRNSDRPYKTNNLYDELKNIEIFKKEVYKILAKKGMSKKEIDEMTLNNNVKEIKLHNKKIRVPMRGRVDLNTKRELERAVKKAKLKGEIPDSAQDSIPYNIPYEDGVFESAEGYFTKTIAFEDITYQQLDNQPKDKLFDRWCRLINYFDKDLYFQFNYGKMECDKDIFVSQYKIKNRLDGSDDLRKEYSDVLTDRFSKSSNSFRKERYLTYGVKAADVKAARLKMAKIDASLSKLFKRLECKAKFLDGYERLELLFRIFHPASKDRLFWNFDLPVKTGLSSKDFIAVPFSFKTNSEFNATKYFKMGDRIGAMSYVQINSDELEDRVISDILDLDSNVWISIYNEPLNRVEAIDFAKRQINDAQSKVAREQKGAVQGGWDMDLLPPELKNYITKAEKLFRDLQHKDEKMFMTTIVVMQTAETRKELENNIFALKEILQGSDIHLERLWLQQEQGFFSSLPLGNNLINLKRSMVTNDLGILIPFTTREIFAFNGQYYGVNSLSSNVIMANRKELVNPNGLILGMPGYGKSFFGKREILDVFLKTTDDIIILDPEGEYSEFIYLLGGDVLDVSLKSNTYINCMDIDLSIKNYDKEADFKPIASKISFMVSLCNLIIGGQGGLNDNEKSCIDMACQILYTNYANNPGTPMPTLGTLHEMLLNMQPPFGEIGKYLAVSLSRYATGSLSYFNHESTFKLDNRIISFNLKEMDREQLDLIMFIIQEHIWSKVAKNREIGKSTWVYLDEFHVFLRNKATADYSVDIWKRFRKWNGIPTGITQNIKDLFRSAQIQNILDVTNFLALLEQSGDDGKLLADHLDLSTEERSYLSTNEPGRGLLCIEKFKIPFMDEYPKNTLSYKVMTTKPSEVKEYEKIRDYIRDRHKVV